MTLIDFSLTTRCSQAHVACLRKWTCHLSRQKGARLVSKLESRGTAITTWRSFLSLLVSQLNSVSHSERSQDALPLKHTNAKCDECAVCLETRFHVFERTQNN